jgi:hypothetical protein
MRMIGVTKFGKVTPKPKFIYPTVRFPNTHSDIVGHKVTIYETEYNDKRAFMLILDDDSIIAKKVLEQYNPKIMEKRLSTLETDVRLIKEKVM